MRDVGHELRSPLNNSNNLIKKAFKYVKDKNL